MKLKERKGRWRDEEEEEEISKRLKSIFNFQPHFKVNFLEQRGEWKGTASAKVNSAINLHHKYTALQIWKQKGTAMNGRMENWKIRKEWEWREFKKGTKPRVKLQEEDKERKKAVLWLEWKETQADGGVIDLELTRIKMEWQRKETEQLHHLNKFSQTLATLRDYKASWFSTIQPW